MRALVSGRAAVGWSSFRLDGTFLWTHAILPAGHVTTYLRPAQRRRALAAAATYLRCPVCASPLHLGGSQLACRRNHGFDIARQGYVSFTAGRVGPGTGDTCAMVAARDRFLSRGHYQRLAAPCSHSPRGTILACPAW